MNAYFNEGDRSSSVKYATSSVSLVFFSPKVYFFRKELLTCISICYFFVSNQILDVEN